MASELSALLVARAARDDVLDALVGLCTALRARQRRTRVVGGNLDAISVPMRVVV